MVDAPDFTPARLWHYVVGDYVSPMLITPRSTLRAILAGKLMVSSTDVMLGVTETAKALNKIMGKNEFTGVRP